MFESRAYIYYMATYNSSFCITPNRRTTVLTVSKVAEQLRPSPNTVKRLLRRRDIKGVRTGPYGGTWRVSQTAIDNWMCPHAFPRLG